ncbi:MAG: lysylphosphatidylglycerol synthase transmembrane domain-containing protein [Bacteroidota bacterium]|nr:lysylphosphatidylglycerol synthase transmembrane domain-containing protein [Bacteroidota bacterium]MDP4205277.1 lysylphosphatidylglycerol synthase transmembrane domain-containing protein [Bacteroidota bacterium]
MKSKIIRALKYLSFLAAGIFIFWLLYRDQSFSQMEVVLKNDVNYIWVIVPLAIGLLAHFSRALRWRIMIEPLGHVPSRANTFMAVMIGYLMNLVFPRLGEVSRCGVLSRYEKISFPSLVGTVVLERMTDVIMLLLMSVVAIIIEFDKIVGFWINHPQFQQKLIATLLSKWLLISLFLFILFIWIIRRKIFTHKIFGKFRELWGKIVEGIATIKTMKKKKEFIFHSIFIWIMYFMMLYTGFFSLKATSGLLPDAGLTTFVLGSFGMIAPVQGGIGAWHFMTREALSIYGIAKGPAVIFALLSHATMTMLIIVVGLLCLLAIPLINRKKL